MSQIRRDKERKKEEVKMEKGKEKEDTLCGLILSGVLDLRDFCLEGFERVSCTCVTREFIPLDNPTGKEREPSIILVCSNLSVLILASFCTSF